MSKAASMVKAGAKRTYAQAEATVRYVEAVLFKDERGDTNFVSILILLGIALTLAAFFFAFRDRILDFFQENTNTFNKAVDAQHSYTASGR